MEKWKANARLLKLARKAIEPNEEMQVTEINSHRARSYHSTYDVQAISRHNKNKKDEIKKERKNDFKLQFKT